MESGSTTGDAKLISEPDASSNTPADTNAVSPPATNVVLPGVREYTGRHCKGSEDVLGAITLLSGVDIPSCVVGVKALQYYGAGRISWVG